MDIRREKGEREKAMKEMAVWPAKLSIGRRFFYGGQYMFLVTNRQVSKNDRTKGRKEEEERENNQSMIIVMSSKLKF